MKHIGRLALFLCLAVNAFFIGMLLLTAYSPYINPEVHPVQSCLGLTFPIFLVINFCFLIFWLIVRYRFALVPLLGFLLCYPQLRTYMPVNPATNPTTNRQLSRQQTINFRRPIPLEAPTGGILPPSAPQIRFRCRAVRCRKPPAPSPSACHNRRTSSDWRMASSPSRRCS